MGEHFENGRQKALNAIAQRVGNMEPTTVLNPGEQVRDNYGRVLTVAVQRGTSVLVVEDPNNWIHITKLFRVSK